MSLYARRTDWQHICARYLKLLRNVLGWFDQKLKTLHHGGCCSQKPFTWGNNYSKDRRGFLWYTNYFKLQKQRVNPADCLLTLTTDRWLNTKQIYIRPKPSDLVLDLNNSKLQEFNAYTTNDHGLRLCKKISVINCIESVLKSFKYICDPGAQN